jgi:hypothetical protein
MQWQSRLSGIGQSVGRRGRLPEHRLGVRGVFGGKLGEFCPTGSGRLILDRTKQRVERGHRRSQFVTHAA